MTPIILQVQTRATTESPSPGRPESSQGRRFCPTATTGAWIPVARRPRTSNSSPRSKWLIRSESGGRLRFGSEGGGRRRPWRPEVHCLALATLSEGAPAVACALVWRPRGQAAMPCPAIPGLSAERPGRRAAGPAQQQIVARPAS